MTPLAAIRARRSQVRARAPRRLPVQAHPDAAARAYAADLLGIVAAMRAAVERRLGPVLRALEAEQEAARRDETNPDPARLIREARLEFERTITVTKMEGVAGKAGEQLDLFNRGQVERQLQAALPIDVRASFGSTAEEIAGFTREGVGLIRSMSTDYFDEVEAEVQAGFESGRRASSIARDINRRGEVSESHARFIARDQCAKLNGRLTEKRQADLGVKRYVWRTSQDSRVRSRHRELDGQSFDWENPPIVDEATGRREHPGGDYACRCRAEPDLESLLDELEAEDIPPAPAEAMVAMPAAARPILPELPPILPPPPLPPLPMQAPARWSPPPLAPKPTLAELQAKILATQKRIAEVEAATAEAEFKRKAQAIRRKIARLAKSTAAAERSMMHPGRTLN